MSDETTTTKGTPGRKPSPVTPILQLVREEVARQDEKWGEQNYSMTGGRNTDVARAYFAERADNWKGWNAGRVEAGEIGWDGILLEESYEAAAEADVDKQVEELVQVAAVAVNAILSLQRQAGR